MLKNIESALVELRRKYDNPQNAPTVSVTIDHELGEIKLVASKCAYSSHMHLSIDGFTDQTRFRDGESVLSLGADTIDTAMREFKDEIDKYPTCDHCGALTPDDEITEVYTCYGGRGRENWCNDCVSEGATACDDCGDWYADGLVAEDDFDNHICTDCMWDNYTRCDDCGRLISFDDAITRNDSVYCYDCAPQYTDNIIGDYHDGAPNGTKFQGYNADTYTIPYYGVEIEMDRKFSPDCDENENAATKIRDILNGTEYDEDDLVWFEHDGSISRGFEMITQPMTYDFLTGLPWEEAFRYAVRDGLRGHDTGRAGLHVHVSRKVFSENDISRIVYFFDRFWDKIVRFTRRTEYQLEQYAEKYNLHMYADPDEDANYDDDEGKRLDLSKRISKRSGSRYRCINMSNRDTIEFRVFRGTLNPTTFRATIEFVKCVCDTARRLTDEQAMQSTWMDWFTDASQPLLDELKKRGTLDIADFEDIVDETIGA